MILFRRGLGRALPTHRLVEQTAQATALLLTTTEAVEQAAKTARLATAARERPAEQITEATTGATTLRSAAAEKATEQSAESSQATTALRRRAAAGKSAKQVTKATALPLGTPSGEAAEQIAKAPRLTAGLTRTAPPEHLSDPTGNHHAHGHFCESSD